MRQAFLLIGLAALGSAAAYAQTDVAASLYGAFTGTATGNGVVQSPSNSAGGLLEVRHISRLWVGYEGFRFAPRARSATSSRLRAASHRRGEWAFAA